MVQNIREAFIENLETVDWMDSQTKQAAKEKVRGLRNSRKNSLRVLPDRIKGLENFTIVNHDLQETVFALKEARPRIQSLKTLIFRRFQKIAEDFRTVLRRIRRCFDQRATYLIVEVSNITSNVIDIITGKNYRNFTRENLWLLSGLDIIRSSYIETTAGLF